MVGNVSTSERDPRIRADATFEEFFRAEYEGLLGALILLCGTRGDAEDLAQDAMTRVLERWDRVRVMDSPVGYLFRVALNMNRNRLRHLAVASRRALGPRPPEDFTERADARASVRAALMRLPRREREAVVLAEWLGLDSTESSRVLGCSASTVRARLMKARSHLARELGGTDG